MLEKNVKNYAANYSTNGFIQHDAARTLIEFIGAECGKNILDVGCGSGRVTQLLNSSLKPNTIHAIDKSDSMINEAKKKYNYTGITFENSSIEDYCNNRKYDLIISNSSFLWFSNFKVALDNIKNLLANNGGFYIQTSYTHRWCPEFIDIVEDIKCKHEDINEMFSHHTFPCFYLDSETEYCDFLESHGLSLTKFMSKNFVYSLPSSDAIKVFNSGPIKAYTDPLFFSRAIESEIMNKFYNLVNQTIKGCKELTITYPRAFMLCKKL